MAEKELPCIGEERPIKIYAPWFDNYNASTHYRIKLPFQELSRQRRVSLALDLGLVKDQTYRGVALAGADIDLYYALLHDGVLQQCLDPEATPVIFSHDDDLEYITPYNGAFCKMGTRDENGRLLEPGDSLCTTSDGSPLWVDKCISSQGVFDIERNLRQLDQYKAIVATAAGVMASREPLAERFRSYGSQNVYVYPNCLDFTEYSQIPTNYPDEVRILWQGSAAHYEDWQPVRDTFVKVLDRNPKVKFIYWGTDFPWVTRGVRPEQLERISWLPYEAYITRLCTIGHDINFAPLSAATFAESKSAIKFYESSAIPDHPAATIASNFGPYRDEIIHAETGLLYNDLDELEEMLQGLIDDAALRKTLAANAADWVHENRDVKDHVGPLAEWVEEIHARDQECRPKKPRLAVVDSAESSD